MADIPCSMPGCKNPSQLITITASLPKPRFLEQAYCDRHESTLPSAYSVPNPEEVLDAALGHHYEPCHFHAAWSWFERNEFTIVLRGPESRLFFSFPTGYIEACIVYNLATNRFSSGPTTHQLLLKAIEAAGGQLIEAVAHGYDRSTHTYRCRLQIQLARGLIAIPCRVSDAVALSLICNISIQVDKAFLGETQGQVTEHIVQ